MNPTIQADSSESQERSGTPRGTTSSGSSSRRLLFRFIALALALLPFAILEIALRWSAPQVTVGVDADPFVDLEGMEPLFHFNQASDRWEIASQRQNLFRPASFAAKKATDGRRIFVLGGSTVQGRPYQVETSMTAWLKLRLESADPGRTYEVVNCGGVSYASYRVNKILDEVLQYEPDAIVIYTGHNEFLEDREYADVRNRSVWVRTLGALALRLRTVTWIQQRLGRTPTPPSNLPADVDARLDHVGGLERYQRDPQWKAGVERHFGVTLNAMIKKTQLAGVPLILCEPASELVKTPPFKVQPPPDATPQLAESIQQQWARATDSSLSQSERLAAAMRCLELDPQHAGANYVAGRIWFDRNDPPRAKPWLIAARDFDVCPLRATSPIVEQTRQLAAKSNVPLVPTIALLDQRDPLGKPGADGISDPENFVDHVHPTVAGHQRIAAAIASELEHLGWFTWSSEAESRYGKAIADHLGQLGPEYYARGQQRLQGLRLWASGRVGGTSESMPMPPPSDENARSIEARPDPETTQTGVPNPQVPSQ